jgi:hypothetical protein
VVITIKAEYVYKVVDYVDGQMKYAPVIVRCDEQGETIVYFGWWSETKEQAEADLDNLMKAGSYEQ